MKLSKWKEYFFDSSRDLQERVLMLLTVIALSSLAVVILMGIAIGESRSDLMMLIVAFFLFLGIALIAFKTHMVPAGALAVSLIIVLYVLPVAFITTGGIEGGTPLWFVFCALFISMILTGKARIFCLLLEFAVGAGCYYVSLVYPELITPHTFKTARVDSFLSLVIVSVLVSVLTGYEVMVYRRESERAKQQKKEIDELSKAQNQFFSSMSHEIRTPINTIIGLNEMILREEISPEVAEDAKNIQSASKMLLHLINEILDISKADSGHMTLQESEYNTGDMLSDIVGMLWLRAKNKGLEFHIEVDPMLPSVLIGDEIKIKEVLINLLTNAVKYTNEGSVTLSIQCEKAEDRKVTVTYSVIDTGIGIKKENIPHLFSAFRRVDENNNRYIEGTGLGLSIAQTYVKLMGGDIRVNSVYTQGSTFVVELKQEVGSEEEVGNLNLETRHMMNQRRHYKQSYEAPSARILVVDDNDANLMVVSKLLRGTGARIDTVKSGAEALQKSLELSYDLIFMDHMMPEMDGIECHRALRSQTGGLCKDSKIVALTANAGPENRALYAKEGFDGYLEKPVTGEDLDHEMLRQLPREKIIVLEKEAEKMEEMIRHQKIRQKRVPVLITTDSVCDLPSYMIENKKLVVQSYHVNTDKGYFLDDIESDSRGLLLHIKENRGEARSESPSVQDYEAFFAAQLGRANHVIHIAMASGVSNGYVNGMEAAKAFDNVHVVDCGHLSSGMGLAVLEACRMVEQGKNADEILARLAEIKSEIQTSFIVDSTDFLVKSGRINKTISRLAQTFMLRPVLVLNNSKMHVGKVCIGNRRSAWKNYITSSLNSLLAIDTSILFVTHVALTQEDCDYIRQEILKKIPFEQIIFQKASPAISINCGPGTFGLLYQLKH